MTSTTVEIVVEGTELLPKSGTTNLRVRVLVMGPGFTTSGKPLVRRLEARQIICVPIALDTQVANDYYL